MINGKTIFITGGTGTFGKAYIKYLLDNYSPKKIIIFSRDELKQFELRNVLKDFNDVLRFFIGNVRDLERLKVAMQDVDIVIHAAALKQVPAIEYNPYEALKTNVMGAHNIIESARMNGVKRIIALSTDKACMPINFYGGTKLLSDKLFQSGNVYSRDHNLDISVVRYGNVAESRGSVIPFFRDLKESGFDILPVTHEEMTRFWITVDEAINLVMTALKNGVGGEIFISKIPSFRITDLVEAMGCGVKLIGIRPGEKLHEQMVTVHDSCREFEKYYCIYPEYDWYDKKKIKGKKLENFEYTSDNNPHFLTVDEIRSRL